MWKPKPNIIEAVRTGQNMIAPDKPHHKARENNAWPGWLGLLTAVIANTILTATGAWPPLELCWEHGSLVAPACLVVFTAPVWGGGGAILVLMGYLRAGANVMIVAGALTAIAYLYFAPIFSILVCLAYLAAGIKAHNRYRRPASKKPPL